MDELASCDPEDDYNLPFEELPRDSDDDNEIDRNNTPSSLPGYYQNEHLNGNADNKKNQMLLETYLDAQNPPEETDIDGPIINLNDDLAEDKEFPYLLETYLDAQNPQEEIDIGAPTINSDNHPAEYQYLFKTDQNTNLATPKPVDSDEPITVTGAIVQIRKSTLKKREGHYKADGDVIVTKPFLVDKVKRLKFQTLDVINFGDVLKISMEAQQLGKKFLPPPRLLLEKEITGKSKCKCFDSHLGSPFCVIPDDKTVERNYSDDTFLVILRPTKPGKIDFEIGLWSANFGKDYVAVLEFQVERLDGITFHQRYYVKTCAAPERDLNTFKEKVNHHFNDRYKWYEEGSVSEEEPQRKKMRLNQTVSQLPLLVEFPEEYSAELMNFLKDDSQYNFMKM